MGWPAGVKAANGLAPRTKLVSKWPESTRDSTQVGVLNMIQASGGFETGTRAAELDSPIELCRVRPLQRLLSTCAMNFHSQPPAELCLCVFPCGLPSWSPWVSRHEARQARQVPRICASARAAPTARPASQPSSPSLSMDSSQTIELPEIWLCRGVTNGKIIVDDWPRPCASGISLLWSCLGFDAIRVHSSCPPSPPCEPHTSSVMK